MSGCSKKIMGNNAEYVSVPSLSSSGKEIEEFIKELVYANFVVKRRIFVKFVHLIWSLGFPCRSVINVAEKMVNFYWTKISLMLTA